LHENGDITLKEKNELKADFNTNNDDLLDILSGKQVNLIRHGGD
jgi:hypothetical protein